MKFIEKIRNIFKLCPCYMTDRHFEGFYSCTTFRGTKMIKVSKCKICGRYHREEIK